MSLLLKDRVWSMESKTAKRGVYPLHGYKLGLYRLPINTEDPLDHMSIHDGLKKTFEMDMYADRIYATYRWNENNGVDPDDNDYEDVDLSVTVEIVTGEVTDLIYQIFPIDQFGDPHWVKDYRKKADYFAKMTIDTILRNTVLADKMISYVVKSEKMSEVMATQRLDELTPLAMIVLGGKPKASPMSDDVDEDVVEDESVNLDDMKIEPIDPDFKSKLKPTEPYVTEEGYEIKTWGRKNNKDMGIFGSKVAISMFSCIADSACLESCPVDLFDWLPTPGHPTSDKKIIPRREQDCITCLACQEVCPTGAIKIF